jgi:hypothetical protein
MEDTARLQHGGSSDAEGQAMAIQQPVKAPDEAPAAARDNAPSSATTMKVAVAVLVLYIAFVVVLIAMRGDAHWDRLVYLLSGFEAIVFAAIGWMFGTTVSRGAVQDAKSAKAEAQEAASAAKRDAEQQRVAAEKARSERDDSIEDAVRGRSLAASIRAKRGPTARQGARPEEVVDPGSDLAELRALVDELYPA